MNVNGLQIEEHGAGYALTIRAWIGKEEANNGLSDDVTARFLEGLARLFVALAPGALANAVPGRPAKSEEAKPEANLSPSAASRRPAPAAPSSSTTDEDLTKAASLAARKFGPPAVMELLEEFGVSRVGDLEGERRAEFVGRLKEMKA